jgi:hypothetical protein
MLLQMSFADLNLDGKLDVLLPVCHDGLACSSPALYFARASEMFDAGKNFEFERVDFDAGNFTFDMKPGRGYYHPYR